MSQCTDGKITFYAASSSQAAFRLVKIDSSGYCAYPNASVDDDCIKTVGVTCDAPDGAQYQTVAGFGDGTRKVTVAASQTVAAGDDLYMTGTTGCVQTGASGWLVGVAKEGATSGASELAVIEAVLNKPQSISAGT